MLINLFSIIIYIIGVIVTGIITVPGEAKDILDDEILSLGWFFCCMLFPLYWVYKLFIFTKLLLKEFL